MPIPAEMVEQAKEYRDKLIEAVSDFDDVIAEKYLSGEEITRPSSCSLFARQRSPSSSRV
jgi:translation elongation factor EF-G